MNLHPTHLPAADPRPQPGRLKGERCWSAPSPYSGERARSCRQPAAIHLHRAVLRSHHASAPSRPRSTERGQQTGAHLPFLAQPVPYHALHGETGEGFEARRVALRPAGRRHCHSRARLSDADPRNRHHHAHGLTDGPCAVCHLAHHWSRDGNRVRRVHNLSSPGFFSHCTTLATAIANGVKVRRST